MRLIVLCMILLFSSTGHAAQVHSVREAWDYLAKPDKAERWVVIASTRNKGYFQCENMGTFIRCPIPVWNRVIPGRGRYAPAQSRTTPYPGIAGSKLHRFLTEQQVASAKKALRLVRVKPQDVYSRLKNEEERIIGTSYEIRVVLEFGYTGFEKLVESYMQAVWNTSISDGYTFETAD